MYAARKRHSGCTHPSFRLGRNTAVGKHRHFENNSNINKLSTGFRSTEFESQACLLLLHTDTTDRLVMYGNKLYSSPYTPVHKHCEITLFTHTYQLLHI